jgi:hypothetical protein
MAIKSKTILILAAFFSTSLAWGQPQANTDSSATKTLPLHSNFNKGHFKATLTGAFAFKLHTIEKFFEVVAFMPNASVSYFVLPKLELGAQYMYYISSAYDYNIHLHMYGGFLKYNIPTRKGGRIAYTAELAYFNGRFICDDINNGKLCAETFGTPHKMIPFQTISPGIGLTAPVFRKRFKDRMTLEFYFRRNFFIEKPEYSDKIPITFDGKLGFGYHF